MRILTYRSLLAEAQTGNAWKPTKEQSSLAREFSLLFSVFKEKGQCPVTGAVM
jgi:hypothetical protein